ncbi:protein tipE-like isoform X1 [Amphibalanus amphitrite]|uniref:protein tipE-like isoform X1 n=1 Tax=Amphibalanus amphitrite TaxID=1232801 RepID=UPI001C8FE229|nr:protein tipE-like isoform X1 [Amphibalanus amphitrite]
MTISAEHSRLSDDEADEQELEEVPPKLTLAEKLKKKYEENLPKLDFYATVLFSLVAIGAFFGFLFLVPFVIEPAVTTIQMDFEVEPVTCCVVSFTEMFGASNCSDWTSCREGCTREIYECVKILVAYTDAENFTCSERPPGHQWLHNEAYLYPNVKGCGYPPTLNCTIFHDRFRDPNVTFPCYYSRVDATLVITELDPEEIEHQLMLSIVAPAVAFVVSIAYLVHAYHRMKRKEAAAAERDRQEKAQCLLEREEEQVATRSNATSTYSIKSISSKINATMVRLARERRKESGDDEAMELEQVVPEARPPSRYLKPGRMPSGNRHNLLEPLEPPAGASDQPAPQPESGKSGMSPVET